GNQRISGWTRYAINSSMLTPVDHFEIERPFDPDIYQLCAPDTAIKVKIDNVTVLVGFTDSRRKSTAKDHNTMQIAGRDRAGHMVQESAPFIAYDGLDLLALAKKVADPWFTNVVLSDARNRQVRLGKGHKAVAATEPLILKVKR